MAARAELIQAYMPALSAMARTYRTGRITRQERSKKASLACCERWSALT